MLEVLTDVRLALRSWGRSPRVASAAGLSLALGIMAVTVIFGAADALLLRPIPGATTPGLVRLQGAGGPNTLAPLSFPEVEAVDASGVFESLTVERVNQVAISVDGVSRVLGGAVVSGGYFGVLGVRMARGVGFAEGEAAPVAVVSHALWTASLAEDPGVLGRTVRSGGVDFTIVGVADPAFHGAFPGFRTSVWFPLRFVDTVLPLDGALSRMGDRFLNGLGTLREDDPTLAEARLASVAATLASDPDFDPGRTFVLESARGVHPTLHGILGVVVAGMFSIAAMVLLVACANVATLLSARGVARRVELASRAALGATRGRIVRQLVAEAVALGGSAAFAGLLLSGWVMRIVSRADPGLDVPVGLDLAIDPATALFAIVAGVGSAVLFGTWPALRASRLDVAADLRGGGASSPRGRRGLGVLVVAQLAVVSVLLVGAGLMVRSIRGLTEVDPGFARDRVVTVEAELGTAAEDEYWERVRTALGPLPGVEASALGLFVHLGGRADQMRVGVDGTATEWLAGAVNYTAVEAGLFDLLEIGVVSGRPFRPGLTAEEPPEVVVNEALAGRLWPESDPVGRTMRIEDRAGAVHPFTVVGVAETVKTRRLNEDPTPFLYLPRVQWPRRGAALHVRVRSVDAEVVDRVRSRVRDVDRSVPVTVRPMAAHTSVTVGLARVLRSLLAGAGLMGLLIAAVGVFGVVSYSVERRAREIAIRAALGASAGRIEWMVLLQSMRGVAIGLAGGLVGAWLTSRALVPFLFGVSRGDVVTTVGATLLVVGVAAVATLSPTRRVTRSPTLVDALHDG